MTRMPVRVASHQRNRLAPVGVAYGRGSREELLELAIIPPSSRLAHTSAGGMDCDAEPWVGPS